MKTSRQETYEYIRENRNGYDSIEDIIYELVSELTCNRPDEENVSDEQFEEEVERLTYLTSNVIKEVLAKRIRNL